MLEKVISGGQTGADLGGVLAARMYGIDTGGWMPKDFRNQNGNHPEYADLFGFQEHQAYGYKPRTWKNIESSDGTIRLACDFKSAGEICTLNGIKEFRKPHLDINIDPNEPTIYYKQVEIFLSWLKVKNIKVLNVAGNSEKTWSGMQSYTIQFLGSAFLLMGYNRLHLPKEYHVLAKNRGW